MATCINCGELLTGSSKKYCSNKCQSSYRYHTYIREWLDGKQSGSKYIGEVSNHIRRFLHERYDSKCQKCKWGKVNQTTGKVPLTVNHIDGDWSNNSIKNLELLCPNCHSLTSNYGSLNRGKGRVARKTLS